MDTYTITASDLKKNTADILNRIIYNNSTAVIERHGKIVAKIIPVSGKNTRSERVGDALQKTFGSLPDFPDIKKFRVNRKKFPVL